jgi:hypothetical protein
VAVKVCMGHLHESQIRLQTAAIRYRAANLVLPDCNRLASGL